MSHTRRQFLTRSAAVLLAATAPALGALPVRAERAQVIPGSPTFKGAAGKAIVGPLSLAAGVTVLRAQHNGTGNFTVELAVPAAGETPQTSFNQADYSDSFLVFDLIGSVKTAGIALATVSGDHYLQVTASGAWQISAEQPVPETLTPAVATTFSGKGQDVSNYFMLPDGISTISVTTASTSLRAWLYHIDDLGGEPVAAGLQVYDGRIFDFTFPGNQPSYPLSLTDDGPYILAVSNTTANSDAWTIAFS